MTDEINENAENQDEGMEVSNRIITLLMFGFAIVIMGVLLIVVASLLGGGSASVGGIIFIGPFPIVFGAGPDAVWMIAISIVISVVMIVVFVLMRRRKYKI